MRSLIIASLSLLILSATSVIAGDQNYGSGVYSPKKGVICDSLGKWCGERTGISANWTKRIFGEAAIVKSDIRQQDVLEYSNRVKCSSTTKVCNGGDVKIAKKMSKRLFGS